MIATIYSKEIANNLSVFNENSGEMKLEYECWCTKPSTNLNRNTFILFVNSKFDYILLYFIISYYIFM